MADAASEEEGMPAVLLALFVLTKTVMSHDASHPLSMVMADRLVAAIEEVETPWAVQFIRGGVFRDRQLVPLGAGGFRRARIVAHALDTLGFHEISLEHEVSPEAWLQLAGALSSGMLGVTDALDKVSIPGIGWRAIPNASWGVETQDLDPEIHAIVQISLAIEDAHALHARYHEQPDNRRWRWREGMGILRRIERALDSSQATTIRSVELAPGGWTPARRALSAAMDAMVTLRSLDVEPAQYRACAHVALALGVHGFEDRAGDDLIECAQELGEILARREDSEERSSLPPHHVKVVTMAQLFAQPDPMAWLPPMHLISTLYALERDRCQVGTNLDLTRADLLAVAARDMGTRFPPSWVKSLIAIHGKFPAGSYVKLADGRIGVVLDVAPDRVDVLVEGMLVLVPDPTSLSLVSSYEFDAA